MAGYGTGNYNGSGHSGGNRTPRGNYGGRGGRGDYERRGNTDTMVTKQHVALDSNTYVDTAEEVIKGLREGKGLLTTSKIRNLLSMISSLYDEVRRERAGKLSAEERGRIQYIRLHFAYEAGRDNKVKDFVEAADIIAQIKDIGENKEKFLLFCRYMEALVAYHRYYGGKE